MSNFLSKRDKKYNINDLRFHGHLVLVYSLERDKKELKIHIFNELSL